MLFCIVTFNLWLHFNKLLTYLLTYYFHPLLLPDRTLNHVLRTRGHSFQLPACRFNLHKKSFVISCLFKFLTWVCSCFCVVFMFKLVLSSVLSHLTFTFYVCALLLLTYSPHTTVTFTRVFLACTFVACSSKLHFSITPPPGQTLLYNFHTGHFVFKSCTLDFVCSDRLARP